jgi:uncharacterized protein YaiE (UPF0345 family)
MTARIKGKLRRGIQGNAGPANVLTVGTVTTGTAGSSAIVAITGTPPSQQIDFTIPRGSDGPANTLSIGTVTASAPGSAAAATITGTAPTQTLNLTLPRGDQGPSGSVSDGDKGDITVSASGETWTIDNNAVTFAKTQDIATARILGRTTAGPGDIEELTAGAALSLTGGALNLAAVADVRGLQTIGVPAGAITPRTTAGAGASTLETATNRVIYRSVDFDATTQEFAQFVVPMPKGWNEGTVTYQVLWTHPATTVNFGVVFGMSAVGFGDTDAGDAAFGTVVTVTDTGGTTNAVYHSPVSGALTVAGAAENDLVIFQLQRTPADGGDTLAVDARVIGVKIHFTINAATDV